jgi:16S rRNA pseudouridine516 synthase
LSALRRIDQLLSNLGYCSRREARAWVGLGRVTVRGVAAKSAEEKALPADVRVDDEALECPDGILALLHKPAGVVCSHDAKEGPSVYSLLPPRWTQRNPPVTTVGRLDKDTTGVLLVTDRGELVQRWTSPRHKVAKVYEVTVDRDLDAELMARFASGELRLEGEEKPCLPAKLEIRGPREASLEIIEGKYHQVKRMFAAHGYTVVRLHRAKFGEFDIEGLAPGEWRLLAVEKFLAG